MFTINRRELASELNLLQLAADKKNTMPVLQMVLCDHDGERARLTATNLDVTLTTEVEAFGEAWSGCIPLRQFAALVKLLESENVAFTPKPKDRIEITATSAKHLLPTLGADAFPDVDKKIDGVSAILDGPALRRGLERVLWCVTQEESRYKLRGVNFEAVDGRLSLVATDQHRLAVVEMPCDATFTVLVPSEGLLPLLKLKDESIKMLVGANDVAFESGARRLTARLIDGVFPEWQMVMPSTLPYGVEVDTAALSAAIQRASLTRQETYKAGTGIVFSGIKLTLSRKGVMVETVESDKGKSEESVEATSNLNGDSFEVGVNPDYVTDFLSRAGERVKCELKDTNSQLLFTTPDAADYRYVLMPMRL